MPFERDPLTTSTVGLAFPTIDLIQVFTLLVSICLLVLSFVCLSACLSAYSHAWLFVCTFVHLRLFQKGYFKYHNGTNGKIAPRM